MKKKRKTRPWWQRQKTLRRLGILAAAILVVGFGAAWFALSMGSEGEHQGEYLVEPAPAFQLSTIDSSTYVSSEHLGKHNMLLYFNEGMG